MTSMRSILHSSMHNIWHKQFVTSIHATNKASMRQIQARLMSAVVQKRAAQHDSLQSFIDHSSINKLDVDSTVHRGTLFEYTVLEALRSLSCTLHRTGGADDKGIDLAGTWSLGEKEIPMIVQCKNEAKKVGPKYIRELCGISRSETLLALACSQTYTEKALQSFMRADRPVCLFVIDTYENGGGLRQLVWNNVADHFLNGLAVRSVYDKDNVVLKVAYNNKALKAKKK